MTYLVDSDWLIDGLKGLPAATSTFQQLSTQGLAVSIVSRGELFEGAMHAADPAARLKDTRRYLNAFETILLTDPVMEVFARLRAELRRTGRMIADLDLLIVSTAVTHDLVLITRNIRHFGRIPGLRLYQPADPA